MRFVDSKDDWDKKFGSVNPDLNLVVLAAVVRTCAIVVTLVLLMTDVLDSGSWIFALLSIVSRQSGVDQVVVLSTGLAP